MYGTCSTSVVQPEICLLYTSKRRAQERGIHLCCLSEFCIEEQKRYEHVLVLNYSGMEEERMQEVAELLGGVFDSEIAEKRE